MELAEKIRICISGKLNLHQLLRYYNQIKDAGTLNRIYDYILEKNDNTLHEILTSKLSVEELYAISATEKFIREPNPKNQKARDSFYKEIGFELQT